uniref:RB_B domain-containing protein n=1 Tax=Anisakis simplex TaxID=6269 RepID=A0A0M3JJI0_ANISI
LCRAKHGFEFCQKLSIACAQFTKVTIPTLVMDRFYKLPEVVTKCVSEGNHLPTYLPTYLLDIVRNNRENVF